MKLKHFYRAIKVFKRELSFEHPVSIRRVKMPKDASGDCCLEDKKFYIRVDKTLSISHALDITMHEIGHALSWFKKDKDDHGPEWGKACARCYRTFLENWDEIFEKNKD